MAVTATPFGQFLTDLLNGVHNISSDTTKICLLKNTYTPDLDANTSYADVSGNEIAASGDYSVGGQALTNKAITYDGTTNTVTVTADSAVWNTLTGTCRYAVIYRVSSSNANSKLIGLIDFGADRSYSAETATISFSGGLIKVATA